MGCFFGCCCTVLKTTRSRHLKVSSTADLLDYSFIPCKCRPAQEGRLAAAGWTPRLLHNYYSRHIRRELYGLVVSTCLVSDIKVPSSLFSSHQLILVSCLRCLISPQRILLLTTGVHFFYKNRMNRVSCGCRVGFRLSFFLKKFFLD